MKVLIIEDEELAARRLRKLLHELNEDIEILTVIDSVEDSIKWFAANELPELIFMDIMLADGQSFEIFQSVDLNVPIIFTTAYNEFAIKAFEVNSIDYLLKPIAPELLERSLRKFRQLKPGKEKIERIVATLLSQNGQGANQGQAYKTRFLVKTGDKHYPVGIDDIIYFCFSDKLTFLFTDAGKRFMIDHSLDELEDIVDPYRFFRLNRQYLASFRSIKSVHNYFNGKLKVYLKDLEQEGVVVSRERANAFKSWLNR